ncbi:Glycosyltransferase, GT2 family [Cyclonatronum proteinivorum]|uniref:Glycosyltransferase, GT2 family n=1 Tax=Cyclonatronum proteinivorum TaxID=1457365 RepID=A0A345UK01_9BACT|nr:glycosyltransferase [Cyclonatronum proteinivorum]AXJ00803.1 Glycosyltransferase, GT2 family [Cyclonatronum proteinivorum]
MADTPASPEILVSLIVPVYNRAAEVQELLRSISEDFIPSEHAKLIEIILTDDGSEPPLAGTLRIPQNIQPFTNLLRQENAGPGAARNRAAESARGSWLLFLDSDCELPSGFLNRLIAQLQHADPQLSLFGGPDRDRADFTLIQKAINYAMTSPLTTGGIRGGSKALDRFYPRSFNMGIRKDTFVALGGFSALRFGEDLDLSMRVLEAGGQSALIPDLAVYHRRRTTLRAFFRQVFNSGMARVVLEKRHPGSLKAVHLLPSFFVIGLTLLPLITLYFPAAFFGFLFFLFMLLFHAMRTTASLRVSLLSVPASFVQLSGYGLGLMKGLYKFRLRNEPVTFSFEKNFYQ